MKNFKRLNNELLFICVSKYHTVDEIQTLYCENFKNFGENKLQDLEQKSIYFKEKGIEDISWHFIGRIQSNKIKKIVKYSCLIHSVSSEKHLEKINLEAFNINKVQDILLQINLTNETNNGFTYNEVSDVLKSLKKYANVNLKGIMIIGPHSESNLKIRETFEKGKDIFEQLKSTNPSVSILSMGMSNDYKIALEYNSNCLRVGSKIFECIKKTT